MTLTTTSPVTFIDHVLSLIKDNSLCAGQVADWEAYRNVILARAGGMATVPETYPLIREIVHKVKDQHAFFRTPDEQSATYRNPDPPLPTGRMQDGAVYLNLPYFVMSDKLGYADYVDTVQHIIAVHDQPSARGWIVDLRENGGGDMWPMIAGLGPLLGEGVLGSLNYIKGPTMGDHTWSYRNGASLWNDREVCARGTRTAYHVRRPQMPVALLIGEKTASSAEAIVISFVGRPHTRSFGGETAGLSTANSPFKLSDGSELHITTGVFADRSGRTYGHPLVPDEIITGPACGVSVIEDLALGRACEWIEDFGSPRYRTCVSPSVRRHLAP